MDSLTRGVPVKRQYFAICSTFHKMLLFAINDEVMQYQMKSKNLFSVLYQIRS